LFFENKIATTCSSQMASKGISIRAGNVGFQELNNVVNMLNAVGSSTGDSFFTEKFDPSRYPHMTSVQRIQDDNRSALSIFLSDKRAMAYAQTFCADELNILNESVLFKTPTLGPGSEKDDDRFLFSKRIRQNPDDIFQSMQALRNAAVSLNKLLKITRGKYIPTSDMYLRMLPFRNGCRSPDECAIFRTYSCNCGYLKSKHLANNMWQMYSSELKIAIICEVMLQNNEADFRKLNKWDTIRAKFHAKELLDNKWTRMVSIPNYTHRNPKTLYELAASSLGAVESKKWTSGCSDAEVCFPLITRPNNRVLPINMPIESSWPKRFTPHLWTSPPRKWWVCP